MLKEFRNFWIFIYNFKILIHNYENDAYELFISIYLNKMPLPLVLRR